MNRIVSAYAAYLFVCVLSACSIDESVNSAHRACTKGETPVDGFCFAKDGGSANGGAGNGSGKDAGKDSGNGGSNGKDGAVDASSDTGVGDSGSGDAMVDAGNDSGMSMMEECSPNGAVELCYTPGDGTSAQQPCRAGNRTCKDGVWSACVGEVVPKTETCNGIDDDCDGTTDETIPAVACDTGLLGACKVGVTFCQAGKTKCLQTTESMPETCNGVGETADEDCDGMNDDVDPDATKPCYDEPSGCTGDATAGFTCKGQCKPGTFHCISGVLETVCGDDVPPATEANTKSTDTKSVDEDCDGKTDEGFSCTTGAMFDCYTGPANTLGVGLCHGGKQTCNAGGTLDPCANEVKPATEVCDGMDNDCDGIPDNVATVGDVCHDNGMQGVCKDGTNQCVGNAVGCVTATSSTDVCDGLDNDCNGTADQDFNLAMDADNCGACNNKCATASPTCCSSACVNITKNNANCGACGQDCGAGKSCCASSCADLQTDENNCGICGKKCGTGTTCCAGNCVNLVSNAANCGSCGNACNTNWGCCASTCRNIVTDANHCGAACKVCPGTGLLGLGAPKCSNASCQ